MKNCNNFEINLILQEIAPKIIELLTDNYANYML